MVAEIGFDWLCFLAPNIEEYSVILFSTWLYISSALLELALFFQENPE